MSDYWLTRLQANYVFQQVQMAVMGRREEANRLGIAQLGTGIDGERLQALSNVELELNIGPAKLSRPRFFRGPEIARH
jgi:hypothetical protein